jgi:hypothetical protein
MQEINRHDSDEISLKELIQKAQAVFTYLVSKWLIIVVVGIVGASLGFLYAFIQPIKYTSKLKFVLENPTGGGVLVSVSGQFGFDNGGQGVVISGDNIFLFLKSQGLVRETLLTAYDSTGKNTLADIYAEKNGLKEGWKTNAGIGLVDFSKYAHGVLPRKEDSLMQSIVSEIIKSSLTVDKADKRGSFIEVKVSSKDEAFSKLFGERLVKIATDRYIESKTKVKALRIATLQAKADSLSALLNNKTYVAAAAQQSLVDGNPALRTAPIASEISAREKEMAAMIFAEVVKNLEFSKTILNQETPVVQVIDQSTFPLPVEKVSKLKFLLLGGILSGFFVVLFLVVQRWIRGLLG